MAPVMAFLRLRPLQVDLGDMLVQVVAVALGVVLGFAATSWNERAHQRELLHATVANIVDELRSNQSGMSMVLRDHAKAAADLSALVKTVKSPPYISLAKARTAIGNGKFGLNIPLDVAWQIAQNDQGLTLLPYEDRYDLGWIYQLQRYYFQAEDRYRNSLLTLSEPPNGNYYFEIVDLANQEAAVVSAERQLTGLYKTAIDRARQEE
jgi:hypothetical protein